jgi:hypothetical protein
MRMDRAEKRRLDRNNTKNQKWFENLPLDKKIFIGSLIEKESSMNDNILTEIMDRCFKSAIDDNIYMNYNDLNKIVKESNEYILDYKIYLDKKGYEEGFDMIENAELREKVKNRIKKFISEKKDKAKGISIIKKEFDLPNAEISDLWIICRAEINNDQRAVKSLEKINNKNIKSKEIIEEDIMIGDDMPGKIVIEYKEPNVMTINDSEIGNSDSGLTVKTIPEKTQNKKSKLKVISEYKEIKGEYGKYIKDLDGVKIGDKCYSDVSIINAENDALTNVYLDKVKEINRQIAYLNNDLKKCNDLYEVGCKKFDELREVFEL